DSHLKGTIGPAINLHAQLADNALGLINLLGDDVRWLGGGTRGTLEITGTPDQPKINGSLALKDASIFVKAINAEVLQISGEAVLQNNRMTINALSGVWQGESSRQVKNYIGLSGSIDFSQITKDNGSMALDLHLTPADFTVNLKDLFIGGLRIHSAELVGPLALDFSQGPTLTTQAEIQNAIITIPSRQEGPKNLLPLNLNLHVKFDRNVYAVMGDLSALDLSNPLMNMEISSDELAIKGALSTPFLFGKIKLKRGSVSLLGREFSLLTPEQQKVFYPYDTDKIKENLAIFDGAESAMPEMQVTGKVEVENTEKSADGQLVKKKVIILSRIQGIMGAKEQERGLRISFNSFIQDKTSGDIRSAAYSEQEIKVMLLPDFLQSLIGVNRATETQVQTNAVIADILGSRAQSFIFRGLERNLEQQLGLDSLTLEYNFGKDLRHAMGVQETRSFEERKPNWGIGFAKGFFDRLFIDVKYAQVMESADIARTTLNYQITYKLSPICSIMYYQEPLSPQQNYAGNQKITLSSGFSFW
ncbi:MAG: translocation/assembly module TamB domain-containing protein, partial [Candidatus Margulisiibacteriota bacterium]